jgi:hypothetical protein
MWVNIECQLTTVPQNWFTKFESDVVNEIINVTNRRAFVFSRWTLTKTYRGSIRLEFCDIETGDIFHAFYGVCREYVRNSGKARSGGSLKNKNDFRVTKRSKFEYFWDRTGLEKPRRNSEYKHKMRLLKGLYFEAETTLQGELEKDDLKLLTIPADFIRRQFTDNLLTTYRQFADNLPTSHQPTNNHKVQSKQCVHPPQPLTTSENRKLDSRVDKYKGHIRTSANLLLPEDQSVDYWLSDHENRDIEIRSKERARDVNSGFSFIEEQDERFYKRQSDGYLQKQIKAMEKNNSQN